MVEKYDNILTVKDGKHENFHVDILFNLYPISTIPQKYTIVKIAIAKNKSRNR
jgi:hypothetical protein